ncbi:arsinothricin resistance N-acetyltransferase ArsN1 family A [Tahibacter caeni]|uniref:arsinothricin resistance N-acetyltransferase ArsN1 family A n=1 Tax=Tahibacter caeni TaxID=1453545 RepID=UPI0021496BE1|nr:arsinothricin resistance N-acetyltransferase ArsN1 family A [Tahibacter caeni]
MSAQISTRAAASSDASRITAIYNQGIAARSATFETRPRRIEDLLPRIADDRYPLRVAIETDGAVVGWAGLSSYRSRDCYAGIAEFSIYVDASARGRGVGRVLLDDLVDAARSAGFWKVVSRVFPFNAASRALCRACGFREVGVYEKHGRLDGQWLDVVIVERLIPENLAGAAGDTSP